VYRGGRLHYVENIGGFGVKIHIQSVAGKPRETFAVARSLNKMEKLGLVSILVYQESGFSVSMLALCCTWL
jgi:hypothetical protein